MKTKSMLFVIGALCFSAFLGGAIVSMAVNVQESLPTTLPAFSYAKFSFQKNLKLGDNNQDVRQLQMVLNNDQSTLVSSTGIGSKGKESLYFGQLTADAVMRFQAKYRKEVLDPYNIYSPTGFVGVATRKKLNQIVSDSQISSTVSAQSGSGLTNLPVLSGSAPLSKEPLPRLYSLQPLQIRKGSTFSLVGYGFEADNTIHIGSDVYSHVPSQDISNISMVLPVTSSLGTGTYDVWVENTKGNSKVSGQPIRLTITDNPLPTPVISLISPAVVSGTDMVIVTGTGFSASGNDIVSGFGTIKNVSSNGTQISFYPKDLIPEQVMSQLPVGKNIEINFYVINVNGASNIPGTFDLKL